ncbi:hypothetical protein AB840_06310, partial [Megasphaera cerevisiae DSM 20462]
HDGSRHPQQDRPGQTGVPYPPLFLPYFVFHSIPSFLFSIYFDIKNHFMPAIIANKNDSFYSIRTPNDPFRHRYQKRDGTYILYAPSPLYFDMLKFFYWQAFSAFFW